MKFLDNFKISHEKEDFKIVIQSIDNGVVFRGTNLWVLVFATFIASLGLNINSTAVVIGAMLISPLMGPIMGVGLGMAINDVVLLRKALRNYLLAIGVGLATSTIYFFISPIHEEYSEILSRTSPNIYDVLIALFGGFAGILATSSKFKGNVIPGVAIATALMPPLCTAGYGLATMKFDFFFGAFYLFLINSVFIALATLITARILKFPFKNFLEKNSENKSRRIITLVVSITLIPSIYFGYDIVQQNNFQQKADLFIENEAVFPNDYLLKKIIDKKKKEITLTYGGQLIEDKEIKKLKNKLNRYDLDTSSLKIRQGFAYLDEIKDPDQVAQFTIAINKKEKKIQILQSRLDSLAYQKQLAKQIFSELKVQYPSVQSYLLQQATNNTDTSQNSIWISNIKSKVKIQTKDRKKIERWLQVRINTNKIIVHFD